MYEKRQKMEFSDLKYQDQDCKIKPCVPLNHRGDEEQEGYETAPCAIDHQRQRQREGPHLVPLTTGSEPLHAHFGSSQVSGQLVGGLHSFEIL